ncbi:hypothetical protein evm_009740 [Chilo suppressalis]|nr:hypothetical protein evm_009740 [Chilo suppressalis]
MKSTVLAVLVLATLSSSYGEDDGQYRPELYGGDDGKYRPSKEGLYYDPYYRTYKSLLIRNGKYDPIYTAYQPVYVKAYNPYQQLLTPFVKYGDQNSLDQYHLTSPVSPVTYRPPVVPVVSVNPIVYSSTPQPVVFASTRKPVIASPVEPFAFASAPKPVFSSSIKPIIYSSTVKPLIHPAPGKSIYSYSPIYAKNFKDYEANARIIKQENDIDPNGYHYAYETENGINAEESGVVSSSASGTKARGFFEYIGDDGLKYRVDYTADENGFHPSGTHLPQ